MIRHWSKKLSRAIQENDGSEFSCSTKDYYYICPKTEHYYNLMINVIGNNCHIIKNVDEITEPCMKLAVYERGGGLGRHDPTIGVNALRDRCTVVTSGAAWVDFVPFGTQ